MASFLQFAHAAHTIFLRIRHPIFHALRDTILDIICCDPARHFVHGHAPSAGRTDARFYT